MTSAWFLSQKHTLGSLIWGDCWRSIWDLTLCDWRYGIDCDSAKSRAYCPSAWAHSAKLLIESHDQKPIMDHVLQLFARELAKGWTSAGNQVLQFQTRNLFQPRDAWRDHSLDSACRSAPALQELLLRHAGSHRYTAKYQLCFGSPNFKTNLLA